MRAGGIWNLVEQLDDKEARGIAIEEACSCPVGRMVITDNERGKAIESEFDKSIVIIGYMPRGEHGPFWVPGGSDRIRRWQTVRDSESYSSPLQIVLATPAKATENSARSSPYEY